MHTRYSLLIALAISFAANAEVAGSAVVRDEFQRAYGEPSAASLDGSTDGEALRGYVLYPYLQQHRIQLALAANPESWVAVDQAAEEFLKLHGVEPVARELRRTWYASLAKREEWERFLANYRVEDDKTLRCDALTARLRLQRLDGLAPMIAQLWSNASDSLPACAAAFDWLKTQSDWNSALIERRARLALGTDNPAFARQMIALLPKDRMPPLEDWAALVEQPRRAIDAAIADPKRAIAVEALLDGWTRLARGDPEAALQRYNSLVRTRKLDASGASRFALELALALSWNRRSEALIYFAKVQPADFDERGFEWYGRAAIWSSDWKLTVKTINTMPESLLQQTRWRYWLARANELLGDEATARTQYAAILKDDNYYAALAAARLQKPYIPVQESIDADDTEITALAREPPFVRAYELRSLELPELRDSAYAEWRFGYNKLDSAARQQAVVLASRWAWYDQAILVAAEQKLFNDYRLLYPHPFDAEVNAAAKVTGLAPAIIYAMLRQESIFRIEAVSSAGAKGLMQLIPETARRTARRWRLPAPDDLLVPRVNILVGAAHLKDFVDRFNGRVALAFASYNAGPNAVARWLPSKPKEMDVWIENIPFNETRIYVQRALWHNVVFGWLATNAGQNTSDWLATVGDSKN